jgi:hypothetical protein
MSGRKRVIHEMRAEPLFTVVPPAHHAITHPPTTHFFYLNMSTQAGVYIKEFVHGDHGRTRPSVGELLGCRTDILQLDVVKLYVAVVVCHAMP